MRQSWKVLCDFATLLKKKAVIPQISCVINVEWEGSVFSQAVHKILRSISMESKLGPRLALSNELSIMKRKFYVKIDYLYACGGTMRCH